MKRAKRHSSFVTNGKQPSTALFLTLSNRRKHNLGTGLRQNRRAPGEQALRLRVHELAVVVEEDLAEDNFHHGRSVESAGAASNFTSISKQSINQLLINKQDGELEPTRKEAGKKEEEGRKKGQLTKPFCPYPKHGTSYRHRSVWLVSAA